MGGWSWDVRYGASNLLLAICVTVGVLLAFLVIRAVIPRRKK